MGSLAVGPCGYQSWFVDLLVDRVRAQGVLRLVPTHWWVRLVPRVVITH